MTDFKIGQRLRVEGRIYTIIDVINQDDKKDLKIQGPRYVLEGSGPTWSVTQDELRKKRAKILNDFNPPISQFQLYGVFNE